MAQALADKTQAEVLNVDNTLGAGQAGALAACATNHLTVLRRLQSMAVGHNWCIILEDDAQPVDNFRTHAAAALRYAPTGVAGFYIGRAGNLDTLEAARSAKMAWATSDHMISAVAYAVRTDTLDNLLVHYPAYDTVATPEMRFTAWARTNGQRMCYTVPSLVDHADEKSLIFTENYTRELRQLRRAWMVGTASNWNTGSIQY